MRLAWPAFGIGARPAGGVWSLSAMYTTRKCGGAVGGLGALQSMGKCGGEVRGLGILKSRKFTHKTLEASREGWGRVKPMDTWEV